MKYKELVINIANLNMDKTNPRHPNLESQHEIIEWMTTGNELTGNKLYNLAKDILKHGINPSEKVVITKENDDPDYIVMEGNRRITAVKLLNNPDAAPNEHWRKKFRGLASDGYEPIKEISCIFYSNPEDAYHFIEIKHMGETNGAGTVPWGSEEKARHAKRVQIKNRNQKTLDLIDHIRSSDLYDQETKDATMRRFPFTTLERLISDVEFRDFLGLGINIDGNITYTIDPEEAKKPISKIIKDFSSGNKNVRDVINKDKRKEYISEFSSNNKPDQKKRLVKPIEVNKYGISYPDSIKRTPRYQLPTNRKYVVLSGTNIPIDPRRFNRALSNS